MSSNDVVGLQRAIVELVTDDEARAAWMSGPRDYSAARLNGPAANVLAQVDPSGLQAMTMSHVAKKARFDHLHRLHHELEARKAASAAPEAAAEGPATAVHRHRAGEGHHPHTHGDGHAPHGELP
jgi:hypothetical protein